jgi:hypothetical protein
MLLLLFKLVEFGPIHINLRRRKLNVVVERRILRHVYIYLGDHPNSYLLVRNVHERSHITCDVNEPLRATSNRLSVIARHGECK